MFASIWQEAERALPIAQLVVPWVSGCTARMRHSASDRGSEWWTTLAAGCSTTEAVACIVVLRKAQLVQDSPDLPACNAHRCSADIPQSCSLTWRGWREWEESG